MFESDVSESEILLSAFRDEYDNVEQYIRRINPRIVINLGDDYNIIKLNPLVGNDAQRELLLQSNSDVLVLLNCLLFDSIGSITASQTFNDFDRCEELEIVIDFNRMERRCPITKQANQTMNAIIANNPSLLRFKKNALDINDFNDNSIMYILETKMFSGKVDVNDWCYNDGSTKYERSSDLSDYHNAKFEALIQRNAILEAQVNKLSQIVELLITQAK